MKRPFDPTANTEILQQYLTQQAQYQRLTAVSNRAVDQAPVAPTTPYHPLAPYTIADARTFFGREWEIEKLLTVVYKQPATLLSGPSGSGKTSLIQAGLLPHLDPAQWEVIHVRLTERPFDALAQALLHFSSTTLPDTEAAQFANALQGNSVSLGSTVQQLAQERGTQKRRWLFIVDQLETLFAPEIEEAIAVAFLKQLFELTTNHSSTTLLLALRSHAFGPALAHESLATLIHKHHLPLMAVLPKSVPILIEQPAEQFDVVYEENLAQRIISDFAQDEMSLPLLQIVLAKLWEGRDNGRLTHQIYEQLGTVKGILYDHVTESVTQLNHTQQTAARTLIQALAADPEPLILNTLPSTIYTTVLKLTEQRILVTTADRLGQPIAKLAHTAFVKRKPTATLKKQKPPSPKPPSPKPLSPSPAPSTAKPLAGHRAEIELDIERQESAVLNNLRRDNLRLSRFANVLSVLLAVVLIFLLWVSFSTVLGNSSPADLNQLAAAQATLEVQAAQAAIGEAEKQAALDNSTETMTEMENQLRDMAARELAARALALQPNQALQLIYDEATNNLAAGNQPHSAIVGALYQLLLQPASSGLLAGHENWVTAVSFSPDGRFLVTASGDGTAKLWQTNGRLVATLTGHTDWVNTAVFHSNGQQILTAGEDGTAQLWDLEGNDLGIFAGSGAPLQTAVFNSDGSAILTADTEGAARLWDAQGNLVAILPHETAVTAAAFSPDNGQLVTASSDGLVLLWDSQGNPLATLTGHQEQVNDIAFRTDSDTFATVSNDNTLRLWSRDGGSLGIVAGHSDAVWQATFAPSGSNMLTSSADGTARLWNEDGDVLTIFTHEGWVADAIFAADGEHILTASADGLARLWQTDGTLLAAFAGHEAGLTAVSLDATSTQFATASRDGTARVWSLAEENRTVFAQHDEWITVTTISPSGNFIATASRDGLVQLWDRNGTPLSTLAGHQAAITSVVFSANEQQLLTASRDGSAQLWTRDGTLVATLEGHRDVVETAVFSPDGNQILTASSDHTANLWDSGGNLLATLLGHTAPLSQGAFSPDGSQIVTVSQDATARLWTNTGELQATLIDHIDAITRVAFSPNGSHFATASRDGTAKLWNQAGEVEATFIGHSDWVNSIAFSPDGNHLLTASNDGTARLWQLDGTPLAILETASETVSQARFNMDGSFIVTVGRDSGIQLWDGKGNFLLTLTGHEDVVQTAVFSPTNDTSYLLSGSRDGSVRRWSLFPDLATALAEAEKRLTP